MHMADALLSPAVGATFWAGTLAAISWSAKKLREAIDEKLVPLMGVLGAFIFAAQMINFTIPGTASSGHLGGGLLLAIILGPAAAFLTIASVLTVQAFFFADGGLLALGCNIWNLGIYPCFIAYPLIYKPLTMGSPSAVRITAAALLSAAAGLQMGAFSVVVETMLSGRSELPFSTFVLMMQPIHLAIGLVEGFVTAGVVNYIRSARPEILESAAAARPLDGSIATKRILITFGILTLVTGGALSWFASSHPDGLEWSIERVFGNPELPEATNGVASSLKSVQEKTAFLSGYGFKAKEGAEPQGPDTGAPSRPFPDAGTSASGIIGSVLVLAAVFLIGFVVRALRKRSAARRE